MSITTEEAELLARISDINGPTRRGAIIRSLAAERDALKAAINEALTKELPIEGGTWSQEPIGPNETPGEAIRRLIKHRVQIGRQAERDALRAENARMREALTNAAAVIGSFYAFAETADAVSTSGIARCHAMLASMKKNRRRIEETVMQPARAALGEKE